MKKSLLYSIAILSVVGTGCAKLQEESSFVTETSVYFTKSDEPLFVSSHDIQMNDLAKAVNLALRSDSGMREFVHTESLLRFDGDYDFLISRAMDKPVADSGSKTRSGSGAVTFGEMLEGYLPETRSGEEFLASIQELYPDLQVAIPVHAEEWDPATYTPAVVFLPEDYKEFVTQVVPGYDAEGDYIEVDAIHAPDVPVIVISHNERTGAEASGGNNSNLMLDPPPSLSIPTNLTASATNDGIVLSWQFSGGGTGFKIWRKGPGESSFSNIATLPGLTNLGYQDTNVTVGSTYQYYVISYYQTYNSGPSNVVTVTAPARISPLTSFSVAPSGTDLKFTWSGQTTLADIVIEEKGPYSSDYSEIYRQATWQSYCFYTPSNRGKRHEYIAYRSDSAGISEIKEAVIYPPYRNTNVSSNTYARYLKVNQCMDGWLQGAPEYYLKVIGLNGSGDAAELNTVWMYFSDGYNDQEESFTNKNIYRWVYDALENGWLSQIQLWLYESDGGSLESVEVSVPISFTIGNVSIEAGPSISFSFDKEHDDDDCGSVSLFYFDNPEQVLQFPNYGARLTISESGS